MSKFRTLTLLIIILSIFMVSCSKEKQGKGEAAGASEEATADKELPEPITVYTSFYPTKYFSQRIGGELVNVSIPMPSHMEPSHWMPDREGIRAFQKADLVVLNGAGMEKWLQAVSLPSSSLVDTSRTFQDKFIKHEKILQHTHGPGGKHAHKGVNPHVWMDPLLAKEQAKNVLEALKKQFPNQADRLEKNYRSLAGDLTEIHNSLKSLTDKYSGPPLVTSYPSYHYLARRYNLKLINFDIRPSEIPVGEEKNRIRDEVDKNGPEYLLWNVQPMDRVRKHFRREFDLKSVFVSTCKMLRTSRIEKGENFISVMKANVKRLRPVFQTE